MTVQRLEYDYGIFFGVLKGLHNIKNKVLGILFGVLKRLFNV